MLAHLERSRPGWRIRLIAMFLAFSGSALLYAGPEQDFIKRGRDHFGLFQYDRAKENFDKAIALDPTSAEAQFYLGLCLRKMNQGDAALKAFERSLELDPDDLDCQKALAAMYIQMAKDQKNAGNRDGTIQYLAKACKAYPQNCHNWVSLLELWQQERKWQEIARCGPLIKKANREALDVGDDKDLQAAMVIVANACKEMKDHARAKEYLSLAGMIRQPNEDLLRLKRELSEHSKDVATNFLEEGRKLYEERKFKDALEALLKAQGADSGNQEINDLIEKIRHEVTLQDFTQSADEAEAKGEYDTALENLNRALAVVENDPGVTARIASITEFVEKREKAIARKKAADLANRQALAEKTRKIEVILKNARECEKRGDFDQALINYQQALAVDKDNSAIQEAVQKTEKAAAEQKVRLETFTEQMNKAESLFKQDKHDEAYGILKELNEDPLNPQAKILPRYIETCLKLSKIDEADDLTKKLAALQPDSEAVTYFTGTIAYLRGDLAGAREPLSKVYEKNRTYSPELAGMMWGLWFEKYKWGLFLTAFFLSFKLIKVAIDLVGRLKKARAEAALENALSAGQYDKVIPMLEAKLEDSGFIENRKQLTLALAEAYLRKERFADAISRANEVMQKESRNAAAMRILGESYFRMGETAAEAIEKIYGLYKIDETRKDLLSFLANHFKAIQADHKLALEILTKHISQFPDDQETVFYLADLFLKRQNFQGANQRVFERASKLNPDLPEYLHGQIQCLMQAGKGDEANRVLEKAQEKWPDHDLFQRKYLASGPGAKLARGAGAGLAKPAPSGSPAVLPALPSLSGESSGFGGGSEGPTLPSLIDPEPMLATLPDPGTVTLPDPGPVTPLPDANAFELPPLPPIQPGPPAGEGVACPSCGASNSSREYYCGTCGKPIR